jgi:hypothetical protein
VHRDLPLGRPHKVIGLLVRGILLRGAGWAGGWAGTQVGGGGGGGARGPGHAGGRRGCCCPNSHGCLEILRPAQPPTPLRGCGGASRFGPSPSTSSWPLYLDISVEPRVPSDSPYHAAGRSGRAGSSESAQSTRQARARARRSRPPKQRRKARAAVGPSRPDPAPRAPPPPRPPPAHLLKLMRQASPLLGGARRPPETWRSRLQGRAISTCGAGGAHRAGGTLRGHAPSKEKTNRAGGLVGGGRVARWARF